MLSRSLQSTLTFKAQECNVLLLSSPCSPHKEDRGAYVYLVLRRQQRGAQVGSHLSGRGFIPLSDLPAGVPTWRNNCNRGRRSRSRVCGQFARLFSITNSNYGAPPTAVGPRGAQKVRARACVCVWPTGTQSDGLTHGKVNDIEICN